MEVNAEQTICMFMHSHQNAIHNLVIANKSFENIVKFKYLGMTVPVENCSNEEISRLNSGMLVTIQFRIFCSPISFPNTKFKVYGTIILLILCGCETWSEKHID